MDASLWIPTSVAVAAGVATVLAARAWGTRRRRVRFVWESAPMLPTETRAGLLEVTYRDIPVPDPHLVTVRVQNTGPRDVATQDFDSGSGLRIDLNCKFYGTTSASHPSATLSPAIGQPDGWVEMLPMLLHRKHEWVVQLVVEGEPRPELTSPLIDTELTVVGPSSDVTRSLTVSGPFGLAVKFGNST